MSIGSFYTLCSYIVYVVSLLSRKMRLNIVDASTGTEHRVMRSLICASSSCPHLFLSFTRSDNASLHPVYYLIDYSLCDWFHYSAMFAINCGFHRQVT